MLFGRVTYERFHSVWAGRDDNPFSPVLDGGRKYVASSTLSEPLPWRSSVLLGGDGAARVAELKASDAVPELVVLGSGVLLRSLLVADLVDDLQLSIHPLTLGAGTRLFDAEGPQLAFEVTRSVTTTTGVVIANYRRVRA